jgi:hypothetical protein
MVEARIDLREQIPDADLLEQQAPLNPGTLTDTETPSAASEIWDAEEPDRLQRHASVPTDDEEDNPHPQTELGWSS